MTVAVTQIKSAIQQLSKDELNDLRSWLDDLESQEWDAKIEHDIEAGKLDKLAHQAIADFEAGRCREL